MKYAIWTITSDRDEFVFLSNPIAYTLPLLILLQLPVKSHGPVRQNYASLSARRLPYSLAFDAITDTQKGSLDRCWENGTCFHLEEFPICVDSTINAVIRNNNRACLNRHSIAASSSSLALGSRPIQLIWCLPVNIVTVRKNTRWCYRGLAVALSPRVLALLSKNKKACGVSQDFIVIL